MLSFSVDTGNISPSLGRAVIIFFVLSFALLSLISNPFLFEKKGHYFYPVLRGADQELFLGDPIISGLNLFRSSYYDALGIIFSLTAAGPDLLEPVVHASYIVYKFVLMALILNLALTVRKDFWSAILLAAWAAYPKSASVGAKTDVTLFMPILTHLEVAVLLCLAALFVCLRYKSPLLCWLFLSVSLFVHPLVTLHFVLTVTPSILWFLRDRVTAAGSVCGMTAFLLSVIGYAAAFAPPSMDAHASEIFLNQIFNQKHASPFFYGPLNWALAIGPALLALWMSRLGARSDKEVFLSLAVLSGLFSGIALSVASLFSGSVVLVQIQPLRIFMWVNFFSFLVIIMGIRQHFSTAPSFASILLGVVTFSILRSVWVIVFVLLGIAHLGLSRCVKYPAWCRRTRWDLSILAVGCVPVGILIAILFRDWLAIGRLHHLGPALTIAAIVAVLGGTSRLAMRRFLTAAAIVSALAVAFFDRPIVYGGDHGHHWDAVRAWCRENTEKSARFVTPSDVENFPLRSFRSTVSAGAGALLWVDPRLHVENMKRAAMVDRAYDGTRWNLEALVRLAREWDAEYVLLRGAYTSPAAAHMVYESGPYAVFQVDAVRSAHSGKL